LTACSSTGVPALFHAGALLEFHTLQSLSLARSRDASRHPLPSCRQLHTRLAANRDRLARAAPDLHRGAVERSRRSERRPETISIGALRARPDFRALLPGASPLHPRRWLDRRGARCSPGLWFLSRAFPLASLRRCLHHRLLPRARVPRPPGAETPEGRAPCSSECVRSEAGRRSSRLRREIEIPRSAEARADRPS
jgi:hypothetical protein